MMLRLLCGVLVLLSVHSQQGVSRPLVDHHQHLFSPATATRSPALAARMTRVYFDLSGVAGLGNWKDKTASIARRIRELGIERILYGSDGATGASAPREAWAAFRQLPLSDAEFRDIEDNIAPYMR